MLLSRKYVILLRCISVLICLTITFGLLLSLYNFNRMLSSQQQLALTAEAANVQKRVNGTSFHSIKDNAHKKFKKQISDIKNGLLSFKDTGASYRIHIFYYPWYGNPESDQHYSHWNHVYLEHWDKMRSQHYKVGKHEPPPDIGANFYPKIGPYSSSSTETIELHMSQMHRAGIGLYFNQPHYVQCIYIPFHVDMLSFF